LPRKVVRCSLALLVSCAAAAVAGTSTATNPVVTFSGPGTKQVSLEACNSGGCSTIVKWVTVLDPMPVASFSAWPGVVFQGDVVFLTGTGTGAPPLAYDWRILDVLGTQVASMTGPSAGWTSNVVPGAYTVYLELSNAHGIDAPPPALVIVLGGSSFLFSDGFEAGSTAGWSGP
jgi:hypothetical protein